jgi:4-carboxymuconolactone decarboxylase
MARLPLVDPEVPGEPANALLRRIAGDRGRAFNVYRMLANSPGVLERVYELARHLWQASDLPPSLQEIVILRVAQLTGSGYEWSRHRVIAERVGVLDAKVEGLAAWREAPDLFDDHERAALALAEEVTQDVEASADTVEAVRGRLGDRATLELVVLTGLYGMVARVLRTLDVDPEPGDEPMPR